jgi:hypothetical protein
MFVSPSIELKFIENAADEVASVKPSTEKTSRRQSELCDVRRHVRRLKSYVSATAESLKV